jgi:hypothetical protein
VDDSDKFVTLDDVKADRGSFAEAHRHLRRRDPQEWALVGLLFFAGFSFTGWILRPGAPLSFYVVVAAVSFTVSTVVVFFNRVQRDKWYREKAAALDEVEKRLQGGELVPRPRQTGSVRGEETRSAV